MNTPNNLRRADKVLFSSMEGQYLTPEEENFFRNMQFKQEYEPALSNDLIVSEKDNPDQIHLVRVEYDEYLVGRGTDEENEVHHMSLSEALSQELSELGLGQRMTLLQWLRQRNYKGVMFDHNYDLM